LALQGSTLIDLGAMSDNEVGFFTGSVPVFGCACARPGVDQVAAAAIKPMIKATRNARPLDEWMVQGIAADSVQL